MLPKYFYMNYKYEIKINYIFIKLIWENVLNVLTILLINLSLHFRLIILIYLRYTFKGIFYLND